jgi:hypothetical protein
MIRRCLPLNPTRESRPPPAHLPTKHLSSILLPVHRHNCHFLRSPDLWEDVSKTLLLCCCGWGRTVAMASKLCSLGGSLASSGGGSSSSSRGGGGGEAGDGVPCWPSPEAVLVAGVERLQSECGLGYRAKWFVQLAEQVRGGTGPWGSDAALVATAWHRTMFWAKRVAACVLSRCQ